MKDKHILNSQKRSIQHDKQYWTELLGVVLLFLLSIAGLIFDLTGVRVIIVEDLPSISSVALQIQASISGISIAIVALISGTISEEYYGISVSQYFLNLKPIIFKQKTIIIGSIILVVLSFGALLLGMYNSVISLLCVSCILIIISVNEIYSVFIGKHNNVSEIEKYLEHKLFDSNVDYAEKKDYFSNYVSYWSSSNQNKVDYENELERYKKAVQSLLEKNPIETLKLLQDVSSKYVKRLISADNLNIRYRSIEVFEETYNQIWQYIQKNNISNINCGFELFSECERELLLGLNTLPTDDFIRTVRWYTMADIISRINIFCHNSNDTAQDSLMKHVKQIRSIPAMVGNVYSEKRANGERVNKGYLKKSFGNIFMYSFKNPDPVLTEYKKAQRQYEFALFNSLLTNCQKDIASAILKNQTFYSNDHLFDDITFALLVICFSYYIAEKESLDCITEAERNTAKECLSVFKKDGAFLSIVEAICWQSNTFDYTLLFDELDGFLDDYERMPFDGGCKFCIVDSVVKEFKLLLIVLSCAYGSHNNLLSSSINGENAFDWYNLYLGNRFDSTKAKLCQMINHLVDASAKMDEMIEPGMSVLNNIVLNEYKTQRLIDARSNYLNFEAKNQDGAWVHNLEDTLTAHLCDKCKSWLHNPENGSLVVCHLTKVRAFTRFLDETKIKNELVPLIESKLIRMIGDQLYSQNKLELYKRDKNDDESYFVIFNGKPYILIGPDYAFKPYDFRKRKQYDQLTDGCLRVTMGKGNTGLLIGINGLPIAIDRIVISIQHMHIDVSEYNYDPESGLYTYSPSTDMQIKYTKEELEELIFNETILLDISANLNVAVPSSACGYLIEKE